MTTPARYFPVRPGALRMEPGLHRFGTDFGNGPADSRFFQFDEQRGATLEAKRVVLERESSRGLLVRSDGERSAHEIVLEWLDATWRRERAEAAPSESSLEEPPLATSGDLGERYEFFARRLQEDFAVLRADPESGNAAIAVYVCFPSGWRPERILGKSFLEIHAPIPEFDLVGGAAPALVSAMVSRGPYVRFVWTVCADDALDHHPDHGLRRSFADPAATGWLRVERQLTVPFPAASASLFLIRTYLYPFEALGEAERRALASAIQAMSPAIQQYKGLLGFEARVLELLAEPSDASPRSTAKVETGI